MDLYRLVLQRLYLKPEKDFERVLFDIGRLNGRAFSLKVNNRLDLLTVGIEEN